MSDFIGSSKIASSGTPSVLSSGSNGSFPSVVSSGSNPLNPSNPSNPSGSSLVSSSGSYGSGGPPTSSGGDGISYVVTASVIVEYSPGWSVLYMLSGSKVGASWIQNDGESSGGLTCEWSATSPPNTLAATISGAYSTEETFNFTFYPSETETLTITRLVQVQNTGDVDILINGSVLAPGDTAEGINNTDVNPWDYVYANLVIEKA